MPVRRFDVPRSVVLLALCLVVVPAVLWLFVVWGTRPLDPEDVAADRARVEATEAYADHLTTCTSFLAARSSRCEDIAYAASTDLQREPLDLRPEPWDVSTVAALAIVSAAFLIGASWPVGPGVRRLRNRTALLAGAAWLVTAVVGALWWWGHSWVARSRDLDDVLPDGTWSFVTNAATLAALAAVGGAATAVLARRALWGVLVSAVVAVVAGGVVLLADPVAPWLPHRNVEAFLFGEAVYEGPAAAEVCTTTQARWVPITGSPPGDGLARHPRGRHRDVRA